MIFAVSLG